MLHLHIDKLMETYCKQLKIEVCEFPGYIPGITLSEPAWKGYHKGCFKALAACYDTVLDYAKANKIKDLPLPFLGGSTGFPLDEAARVALHTIFAHIRNGLPTHLTICCSSEEEEYMRAHYWEESLTLLGDRQAVNEYKSKVDAKSTECLNDEPYWEYITEIIPDLSVSVASGSDQTWEIYQSRDERLGLCGCYNSWTEFIDHKSIRDFSEIDNFYCLCIIGTYFSRIPYWTWSHVEPDIFLNWLISVDKYVSQFPSVKEYREKHCLI